MRVDLSRPDIAYACVWGLAYLLLALAKMETTSPFSPEVTWLILSNVISFFVIYAFVGLTVPGKRRAARDVFDSLDIRLLRKFCGGLLAVWVAMFVLNIAYSGGLPIVWQLRGGDRTYADFGIPTFTGTSNMLRAFLFAAYTFIFLKERDKRTLLLGLFLVVTGLLEASRGALAVMLLHGVGVFVFYRKFGLRNIFSFLFGAVGFIFLFGVIAYFRGGHTLIENLVDAESIFLRLPDGFFWVYVYITTPLNNINFAFDYGINPLYYPYFSITGLLPTVLRDLVFPPSEYPIHLAVDAFNATSYYAPLLADFGLLGAGVAVAILQLVVSYVHVRATRGSRFHLLTYPVLYMCVVLSVFYMYFLSLVTIMYPLLSYFFMRYRRKKLSYRKMRMSSGIFREAGSAN